VHALSESCSDIPIQLQVLLKSIKAEVIDGAFFNLIIGYNIVATQIFCVSFSSRRNIVL
jgi:hypothetical protein